MGTGVLGTNIRDAIAALSAADKYDSLKCMIEMGDEIEDFPLIQTRRMVDADGDTVIYVEKIGDEDKVRIDTGGAERVVIQGGDAILDVMPDTDSYCRFGRAFVGYYGSADAVGFGHIDYRTVASTAFKQGSDGAVYVNAHTGATVNLRVNNANIVTIGVTTLDYKPNTDNYARFGRAYVGYDGAADVAGFGHIDCRSANNYALRQSAVGKTAVNSKTGQEVLLCVNNAAVVEIGATSFKYLHNTDNYAIFGRAYIGFSNVADRANFGHLDCRGMNQYGFSQNTTGRCYVSANDYIYLYPSRNVSANYLRINVNATNCTLYTNSTYLYFNNIIKSGHHYPISDSTYNSGNSLRCWKVVYRDAESGCSDARAKENVKDCIFGLDFINKLKPRMFNLKDKEVTELDEEGTEQKKIIHRPERRTGLIAQEIKEAIGKEKFQGYQYEKDVDKWFWSPQEFIAPIVKAIQELSNKIIKLEERVNDFKIGN